MSLRTRALLRHELLLVPLVFFSFHLTPAGQSSAFESLQSGPALQLESHGTRPIHEDITSDALAIADVDVGPNFLINLQAGVANVDGTHAYDRQMHFHDESVAEKTAFTGLTDVRRAVTSARLQLQNSEFIDPGFTSLFEIASDVREVADRLKGKFCDRIGVPDLGWVPNPNYERLLVMSCDSIREIREALPGQVEYLARTPNPDPHSGVAGSPFGTAPACPAGTTLADACAVTAAIQKAGQTAVDEVERAITGMITIGGGWSWAGSFAEVDTLTRLLSQVKAYRTFQDLGHALHTTQDFFAHSNYVEVITGVKPGSAIASAVNPKTNAEWRPADVRIPGYSEFTLTGLSRVLGAGYPDLQTGNIPTRWLGQGDACAATNSVSNPSNTLAMPGATVGKWRVESFTIGGGTNTGPQPGFDYCHYHTETNVGLNKDAPCAINPQNMTVPATCDEPSHVNFYFARKAAMKVSAKVLQAVLWPRQPR